MRDHEECEEAINAELARGHEGKAEFLATRCDHHHGELLPSPAHAAPTEETTDDR